MLFGSENHSSANWMTGESEHRALAAVTNRVAQSCSVGEVVELYYHFNRKMLYIKLL